MSPGSKRSYTREADKYNSVGERLCTDCEYHLPLEKFWWDDGRQRYTSKCTKCSDLRKLYCINRRDFDEMMRIQNGACAICSVAVPDSSSLHVDHDHGCCPGRRSCGRCVRGLLCASCNIALGHLGDSITRMESAIVYLLSYGGEAT